MLDREITKFEAAVLAVCLLPLRFLRIMMHSGRFLAAFLAESWFSHMERRSDLTLSLMVEFITSKTVKLVQSCHNDV